MEGAAAWRVDEPFRLNDIVLISFYGAPRGRIQAYPTSSSEASTSKRSSG